MPMIACKNCLAVRLFRSSLRSLFLLFVLGSYGMALHAQTIRIKLVDGRNGRPMADKCINVWVGDRSAPKSRPLLETQTDKNGVANLHLTEQDAEVSKQSQQLACGLQGVIDPVVKYGDTVSIRAGYVSCQPHRADYSWLAMLDLSAEEVLQSGIVTPNACGKAKASPTPGEIVLFVRPLSWWEKLKE